MRACRIICRRTARAGVKAQLRSSQCERRAHPPAIEHARRAGRAAAGELLHEDGERAIDRIRLVGNPCTVAKFVLMIIKPP